MTAVEPAPTRLSRAWRKLRWSVAYGISRFAVRFGRLLPARFCYAVANPISDVCFLVARQHRRNLIANLGRVVGEEQAEAAARRAFRNFARYIIDLYQLPALGRDVLSRRIKFDDWAKLDTALDASSGTIFVTLHLGQAELGGAALSTYHHPLNVIAETLEYGPMNAFIQGLRRSLGMKIIPAKKAKLGVMRSLNRGEVLAMMFDVVEADEGVCVDLFGAPAQVSSAPARIALRTGARVLPAVVSRSPAEPTQLLPAIDFDLSFEPTGDEEADVLALTQAIAHSLERFIERYPDQWFAFRRVWDEPAPAASEPAPAPWRLWALALAVSLGGKLPRLPAYGLAKVAGDIAYFARAQARDDVEDNMRHVLGPKAPASLVRRYAKDAFRNVARYYVDMIRLPKMQQLLERDVRLHGFDRLTGPLERGQSVVVVTAHYGNPEIAVQVGVILGLDVIVLAEPLEPPAFARLMTKIRSAYGARYEDVGYGAVSRAIRQLRAGGCVAIACDRDIQGKGQPLSFFGVPARMPLGAVDLAVRTGSLLMPGYCRRSGNSFDIYFEEPLQLIDTGRPKEDELKNARSLLERVESWISADPGQWMPLERIWKPLEAPEDAEESRQARRESARLQ